MYKIFSPYLPIVSTMDRWIPVVGKFDELVGYSFLGDVFLRNSSTGQFAILFTINPELVPLDMYSFLDFESRFLSHSETERAIFQKEKVEEIEKRLGEPDENEIFIPVPFPFLGGDRSIESYKKGNFFTYLELVGGMQGIE